MNDSQTKHFSFEHNKTKRSQLIVFCEGTRFTKEKHEASVEFARRNGHHPLKHHLLPRTKGFHVLSRGMEKFGLLNWFFHKLPKLTCR